MDLHKQLTNCADLDIVPYSKDQLYCLDKFLCEVSKQYKQYIVHFNGKKGYDSMVQRITNETNGIHVTESDIRGKIRKILFEYTNPVVIRNDSLDNMGDRWWRRVRYQCVKMFPRNIRCSKNLIDEFVSLFLNVRGRCVSFARLEIAEEMLRKMNKRVENIRCMSTYDLFETGKCMINEEDIIEFIGDRSLLQLIKKDEVTRNWKINDTTVGELKENEIRDVCGHKFNEIIEYLWTQEEYENIAANLEHLDINDVYEILMKTYWCYLDRRMAKEVVLYDADLNEADMLFYLKSWLMSRRHD
jgi:hypothetical protein